MTKSPSVVAKTLLQLERIAARQNDVQAWTFIGAGAALAASRDLDASEGDRGPLHGVSVGVKDVIDVADMPTSHNSPLGDPRAALADAACVAVLRAAGAVILGKTDTTEFAAAGRDAATANPHDLTRTPGGSSAGSAAAVADRQVDVAIATQTGGSTIRPASFCGVRALKPTWGLISREGAKLYANSLDTIGFYAGDFEMLDRICGVFNFASAAPLGDAPLRIGVCRTSYWPRAAPETVAAMDLACERLAGAGVELTTIDLPKAFNQLERAFRVILFREGAAAFLNLARSAKNNLHKDFHERVESRASMSDSELREAYDLTAQARMMFETLIVGLDGVLTPSAPGVAPQGRGPGDPIFNQMWTMLHLPCVNLPFFSGPADLPLGLTLVARRYDDRRLLKVSRRLETTLKTQAS